MIRLVDKPIDPSQVYSSICSSFSGSVLFHYAIVKKKAGTGKTTTAIEYCSVGDTLYEMENIAADLEQAWKLEDVLLIRRTGSLVVGDIISLVAASSPKSDDAFEACKQGISRLKSMKTIQKTEKYDEITCQ